MIMSDHKNFTAKEILQFKEYQQKISFQKADLSLLSRKEKLPNFSFNEKLAIPKIFYNKFSEDVKEVIFLERSTLHKVYRVRTEKSVYILRVNPLGGLYKEFGFLIEEWIFKQLLKKKLTNLKIYRIDISRKDVPFDYEIMSLAKGKSLYDLSKTKNLKGSLFSEFGQLIGKLHQIETKKFGPLNIENIFNNSGEGIYNLWSDYILKNLNEHLDFCLSKKIIKQSIYKIIVRLFEPKKIPLVEKPVLLHGDIANHNVFSDGKKITDLIDWEDCLSGDPVYDIAYFGTGAFDRPAWFSAFLSGYKSMNKLSQDFYYRYWLYFLRIAIVKAIIRFSQNTDKNKSLPSISLRIEEGVKNLVYLQN